MVKNIGVPILDHFENVLRQCNPYGGIMVSQKCGRFGDIGIPRGSWESDP